MAVLSYRLWQEHFSGDPSVLNRPISLSGDAFTVIGVMPAGFLFPTPTDIWIPFGPYTGQQAWQNRGSHRLLGIARLRMGVTLDQARAEMDGIAAGLEQEHPDTNRNVGIRIEPLRDTVIGNAGRALWTLLAAVALVLLIACANVANLLLARASARQKRAASFLVLIFERIGAQSAVEFPTFS